MSGARSECGHAARIARRISPPANGAPHQLSGDACCGRRSTAAPRPASRWLTIARYAYALLRDLMLGDLSLRAMSLVYTTMLAVVPLLAFSFSLLKASGSIASSRRCSTSSSRRSGRARRAHAAHHRVRRQRQRLGAARHQHRAVDPVRAVDGAKGRGSFNFVWRVDRPRSFARRFSEYLSVMLVVPLLMSVAMGFTASLASRR